MIVALVLAAAADAATMLLLPPGGELNPLGAHPAVALLAKLALTCVLVAWVAMRLRYGRAVVAIAAVAWTFGAIVNVASFT